MYEMTKFGLIAKPMGHAGNITHVDFSRLGEEMFLQSNSSTCELLFWNKRQTPGSQSKRKWDTHNCVLGWNTTAAQVQTALSFLLPFSFSNMCWLMYG